MYINHSAIAKDQVYGRFDGGTEHVTRAGGTAWVLINRSAIAKDQVYGRFDGGTEHVTRAGGANGF